MKRLIILIGGVFGAAIAVLLAAGVLIYSRADVDTRGAVRFERALPIPPLLAPRPDASGRKVFDLELQQGSAELVAGKPAATWGINGPHLGPTLRTTRGDRVLMRVRNALPEPTTIHWHGMHLPARADGNPHQLVEPGATWTPSWTIDQPAATLWYHPHLQGETEDHVYRGLAGMLVVDDPQASRAGLPDDYGVDDIPVIVQDKRLKDDGSLDFSQHPISPIGRLGDDVLVNGALAPHLVVRRERVRLRLLNGSTARIYDIGFADDRAFQLVGTDGGLLQAPVTRKRVRLSPGERAEVVVGFEPGERVVLRSFPPDLGTDPWNSRFSGGDDTLDLMEIRAAARLARSPAPPAALVDVPELDPGDAATTRRFELTGSSNINGRRMDMARIDAVARRHSTEVWEVENRGGTPHTFHVHGVQFQLLRYAGGPPPPELRGWKDTIYVPAGESAQLIMRFPDYGDDARPYMFHCHLLEHEDRGMMGQFLVTDDGRASDDHHG